MHWGQEWGYNHGEGLDSISLVWIHWWALQRWQQRWHGRHCRRSRITNHSERSWASITVHAREEITWTIWYHYRDACSCWWNRNIRTHKELSNMIYNQGRFPNELNKSIFITLTKVNETIKMRKATAQSAWWVMWPSLYYELLSTESEEEL